MLLTNRVFRVIMAHLKQSDEKIKEVINIAVNAVKTGDISNNLEFVTFVNESGVDYSSVHKALDDLFNHGTEKDAVMLASHLGEKGCRSLGAKG